MGRPRVYSDEFRRRAIEEVLVRGRKGREVARDLGIAPETLRRWVAESQVAASTAPPSPEVVDEIKRLRKEVADQQRTIEILKAATTYFREGSRPSNQVMVSFVDEHRETWPVGAMCAAIGLPERTYYAAKARPVSARAIADEGHKVKIRSVWESNYRSYGPRRVYKELRRQGYPIARCAVERLMGDMGIHGVIRGRKCFTTVADDKASRPPDLVDRKFAASRPNELWVADIERHEALSNPAVVKGHRLRFVAADWQKLRAA